MIALLCHSSVRPQSTERSGSLLDKRSTAERQDRASSAAVSCSPRLTPPRRPRRIQNPHAAILPNVWNGHAPVPLLTQVGATALTQTMTMLNTDALTKTTTTASVKMIKNPRTAQAGIVHYRNG
jgi:hypothetical protein